MANNTTQCQNWLTGWKGFGFWVSPDSGDCPQWLSQRHAKQLQSRRPLESGLIFKNELETSVDAVKEEHNTTPPATAMAAFCYHKIASINSHKKAVCASALHSQCSQWHLNLVVACQHCQCSHSKNNFHSCSNMEQASHESKITGHLRKQGGPQRAMISCSATTTWFSSFKHWKGHHLSCSFPPNCVLCWQADSGRFFLFSGSHFSQALSLEPTRT